MITTNNRHAICSSLVNSASMLLSAGASGVALAGILVTIGAFYYNDPGAAIIGTATAGGGVATAIIASGLYCATRNSQQEPDEEAQVYSETTSLTAGKK